MLRLGVLPARTEMPTGPGRVSRTNMCGLRGGIKHFILKASIQPFSKYLMNQASGRVMDWGKLPRSFWTMHHLCMVGVFALGIVLFTIIAAREETIREAAMQIYNGCQLGRKRGTCLLTDALAIWLSLRAPLSCCMSTVPPPLTVPLRVEWPTVALAMLLSRARRWPTEPPGTNTMNQVAEGDFQWERPGGREIMRRNAPCTRNAP